MWVVKGQLVGFVFETLFVVSLVALMYRATSGKPVPRIRKVTGLDAVEEAVGRATEMGRPVHFTPGIGDFGEPMTLAAFTVLQYVARLCARYEARLIVTNRQPSVHPVTESIVKEAYYGEGKPSSFMPTDIRFLSNDQFGYATGVVGIMHREKVCVNLLFGLFYAESLIFAEAGNQAGAVQIAGSAYIYQLPMFVVACDYTLIGDELYAAGAYLSQDPVLVANLTAQDWGKMLAVLAIIAGVIAKTLGSDAVVSFLTK